jgi:hypothetical protein
MRRLSVVALLFVLPLAALSGCKKSDSLESRAPTRVGTAAEFSSGIGSTASANSAAEPGADGAEFAGEADESAPTQRLGTEFGERHASRSRTVRFDRAPGGPVEVLSIRYDDVDSVRQLARNHSQFHSTGAMASSGDGRFRMALLDDQGRMLPGGDTGEGRFAVGQAGVRYRIGIENDSDERFEVVTSVDGLDVIDGGEATLSHRGYVVDSFSSIVIDGWRTSEESIAAFRFSSIDDSYAGRTGRPRNVGIVGAAFFSEDLPAFEPQRNANPSRFAPPPPPRASERWW